MKKITAVVLVCIMAMMLYACGGSTEQGPSKAQIEKETFELLKATYDFCDLSMNYMLQGWDWSNDNDDYSTIDEIRVLWGNFGTHMRMTEEEIFEGLVDCGFTPEQLSKGEDVSAGPNTSVNGMMLTEAQYSVAVARAVLQQRNPDFVVSEKLEQIKENLQKLGTESKAYECLKEFYLMVCEMDTWISSPVGTYNGTSEAIINYNNDAVKCIQELDLMIVG